MENSTRYERKANERGVANFGWLDSRHTFSFGSYYDPQHMGFGNLRVINDDRIAPSGGFDTHGHQNMEIISYAIGGQLAHKDSMGHEYVMGAGDVQRMSAGTGVRHSEFNPSDKNSTHFLQIWILPDKDGHKPSYEQNNFPAESRKNNWKAIVSGSGKEGALSINQDADIFASLLDENEKLKYTLTNGRLLWVQIAAGSVEIQGVKYEEGDGIGFESVGEYTFNGIDSADILLFDLAK